MKIENIGVMLNDTRLIPRLYRLLDIPHHMGIAYFEPLDDIGSIVPNLFADFWQLI